MTAKDEETRKRVRAAYAEIAEAPAACCDDAAACCSADYSAEELARVPAGAVLGEGSGNPVRHAAMRPGEVVVDLGSGAGIDVFLAADAVGPKGRAIGVDMTPEMLRRARRLAAEHRVRNVEFREGVIEKLPVADGAADVVVSNCVINLSPDKAAVFREAFRVLRPGGRLVVSDIVKERPFTLDGPACGCVANAMVRGEYLETIHAAGFRDVEVLESTPRPPEAPGKEASSVTIRAIKPKEVNA